MEGPGGSTFETGRGGGKEGVLAELEELKGAGMGGKVGGLGDFATPLPLRVALEEDEVAPLIITEGALQISALFFTGATSAGSEGFFRGVLLDLGGGGCFLGGGGSLRQFLMTYPISLQ